MKVDDLYHERQRLALCAVHAVNNLLQRPQFTQGAFDDICLALDDSKLFNSHRSMIGIGNYDVNVVITAIRDELDVSWHDGRQPMTSARLEASSVVGVLWNIPATSLWSKLTGGRHWVALLRKDGEWINMDSNLSKPVVIGGDGVCAELLESRREHSHVLIVRSTER